MRSISALQPSNAGKSELLLSKLGLLQNKQAHSWGFFLKLSLIAKLEEELWRWKDTRGIQPVLELQCFQPNPSKRSIIILTECSEKLNITIKQATMQVWRVLMLVAVFLTVNTAEFSQVRGIDLNAYLTLRCTIHSFAKFQLVSGLFVYKPHTYHSAFFISPNPVSYHM